MITAITFVTTSNSCRHDDQLMIVNFRQLSSMTGIRISLFQLTSALLSMASSVDRVEWRNVQYDYRLLFETSFLDILIDHYDLNINQVVDDDNTQMMKSIIDQYSRYIIVAINTMIDNRQEYFMFGLNNDLLRSYNNICSVFGAQRVDQRLSDWFLSCQSPIDATPQEALRTTHCKLSYLLMIQDKHHSQLLLNNKQLIFDFILTIFNKWYHIQLADDSMYRLNDIMEVVLDKDNIEQQRQLSLFFENDKTPLKSAELLILHSPQLEYTFNKYFKQSDGRIIRGQHNLNIWSSVIKKMGPLFVKIYDQHENFINSRMRPLVPMGWSFLGLLDGITSCFKAAEQPLPTSLVDRLNLITLQEVSRSTVPGWECYTELISRGMIGVFESTRIDKFLQIGLLYLIWQRQEDHYPFNEYVINNYPLQIKTLLDGLLPNPRRDILNIDLLIKCCQRSMIDQGQTLMVLLGSIRLDQSSWAMIINACPNQTEAWTIVIDTVFSQDFHVVKWTDVFELNDYLLCAVECDQGIDINIHVHRFLKHAYCLQAIGFNRFKHCQHMLLGHCNQQLVGLFKEFKKTQLIITKRPQPHMSWHTLPPLIINKIIDECILGYGETINQSWVVSLAMVCKTIHKACASTIT
ncbi:hypothetical protein SAMD00019534_086820, partial [Acytostelium subglobosum LB1]|uniref:hypothetical protein n=1 Tax=Acytostelium subglobosum LB1 TaxID=1410327 RepID=UPI000644EDBF